VNTLVQLRFWKKEPSMIPPGDGGEKKRARLPKSRARIAIIAIIVIALVNLVFNFIYVSRSTYLDIKIMDLIDAGLAWCHYEWPFLRWALILMFLWMVIMSKLDLIQVHGGAELFWRVSRNKLDDIWEERTYRNGRKVRAMRKYWKHPFPFLPWICTSMNLSRSMNDDMIILDDADYNGFKHDAKDQVIEYMKQQNASERLRNGTTRVLPDTVTASTLTPGGGKA
jgi:hypothetical protein